ncbi:thioredoxin domain protein [Halovivax ruber XH-70]|uniref:Thioredoxin domain protein n=1 Tax=Halovivax ruber (strain DSM 18193 / JCM 13892 / XH-70) TaxID=797302 RepID=L0I8Z0_HALRX|nr:thioredoxin domain-containing protein [Halovivax ruber]AGB16070.1 thioredoxin domain protein [Halovivax ruber XH-70]
MSDPLARNRLGEEASPYLRQHADNPVNWQPWDERARSAAQERDRPIFLSIGYSACHWCHVMEAESFADETVAAVLNEGFVPIKVDREERPDVDSIYMTVCQAVTGRGGWPLSAWLTPDGRPFYVGTYFPREAQRGTPGFVELCRQIRVSWSENRDEIEARANEWAAMATDRLDSADGGGESASTPEPISADTDSPIDVGLDADGPDGLERVGEAALRASDDEHGGFGRGGPKFPQPRRVEALFRLDATHDRPTAHETATRALDAMCTGGLYDHVGGGFHRYCVDEDWTVPHFEKMLYDNAAIPRVLLAGYQVTGDDRYARTVRETVDFLERELRHPEGGFYSTLDAQSETESGEREEGAFYVWTPAEIESAVAEAGLSDESGALFCDRFGVTDSGNFEGSTVLTVEASIEDLATDYGLAPSTVEDRLDAARTAVFEARATRPRPPRDEKILAGWNGLAIDMLAEASIVLGTSGREAAIDAASDVASSDEPSGDDRYAQLATDALAFVRTHLWDDDTGRLARRVRDGDVGIDGYLEDYAFLARGALTCYEATGEVEFLAFALDLARAIRRDFWDESAETLYFTPERGESLLVRPQELGDQSTPSPTGVAVEILALLDPFTAEPFGEMAHRVVSTHATEIEESPFEYVSLSLAQSLVTHGPLEVTTVADGRPMEWERTLGRTYLPRRLLAHRPASSAMLDDWLDVIGVDTVPPIWADREQRADEPTVYVCADRVCSPPEHDLSTALTWHDGEESTSDGAPF